MKQLLASLLILGACADQPAVSIDEAAVMQTEDGDPVPPSMTNFCRNVTVTGSIFYNDLRASGRFAIRDKETGGPGTKEAFGSADDRNYLALLGGQVDIYEVDTNYNNGASCNPTTYMGTTTIDRTGAYRWTGQVCETCGADLDGGQDEDLSIGVKISLRDCAESSERCTSVRDPDGAGATDHYDDDWDGTIWTHWQAGATNFGPKRISGTSAPIGTDYFQATNSPTGQTARAANVFASIVDVTRKVHTQIGLSFGHPEVKTFFPNSIGGIAHSHESGRLCVTDPGTGNWIEGGEPMHEYGHLIHYWAWNSHGKWVSYCYDTDGDGDDDCAESYSQKEYANAAFKEGWADFVAGVALDGTGSGLGCDRMESDGTLLGCPGGVCGTGRHYFRDVTRVLCDVWDAPNECSQRGNGVYCDNINKTLIEMVDDLEDVWDHADADDKDEVIDADENHPAVLPTFGICSLYDEMSDASKSSTFAASGLDCSL
jgi:hypothetical protein